jgi:predicted nucleotidyltransferase
MLVTTRSGTIEEAIGEVIRSEAQSEGLSVSRIILFGSRARGDADDKSDWDVLVVIPQNSQSPATISPFRPPFAGIGTTSYSLRPGYSHRG